MDAIAVCELTKVFGRAGSGKTAVNNLSFSIGQGEIFGFLGPNGAGKTTTIYTMLGLLKPTSGGGTLLGLPFGHPDALRRTGFLPEYVNLHDDYNAQGLLRYYARLSHLDTATARTRIPQLIERMGLSQAGRTRVSKYSKGMAQRLGLAQALLHDPDLLILDEPTASLDPVGRKEVKDLLLDLKAQGKTILISSHILSDIESLCDRVAIVRGGTMLTTGALGDLLKADDGVRVTSRKIPVEAARDLERIGGSVTGSETTFEIDLPDKDRVFDAVDILRKHGCPLVSVIPHRSSLEDIFFTAVKGDHAQ